MKKIPAIVISMILAAAVMTGLTACGNSAESMESRAAYAETAAESYGMSKEAAYDVNAAGGYDVNTAGAYDINMTGAYDMSTADAYAQDTADPYSADTYDQYASAEDPAGDIVADPNRKLIKEVNLVLETKEYDRCTSALTEQIKAAGGYIENSSSSNPSINDDYGYSRSRSMNITARIPSDRLDGFVAGAAGEGNVTYKSENVTDVTLRYTDTESRRKSLITEQQRLDELMKKAETVEDLIAIEARQSQVRYELESIESQLRTYDNKVDYSTVYISVEEVVDYTPQAEAGLWERISKEFSSCIHGLGGFFEGVLVVLIAYSPVIILVAAATVAVVLIVRKHRRKKEEKRKEKKKGSEENQEEKASSGEKD